MKKQNNRYKNWLHKLNSRAEVKKIESENFRTVQYNRYSPNKTLEKKNDFEKVNRAPDTWETKDFTSLET